MNCKHNWPKAFSEVESLAGGIVISLWVKLCYITALLSVNIPSQGKK